MTNERTGVYDGNAYENVEMLRLQHDEHYGGDVHGDEHLVNHSGAYLVLTAVSQEMNRTDKCAQHHKGKRDNLVGVHAEDVGYFAELSDGGEVGNKVGEIAYVSIIPSKEPVG